MSFMPKPIAHHPSLPRNAQGLTRRDYEGTMSTLCAGCGHDSITAALIEACFELDLAPHRIAKVSGIGCSSKAPTYFLSRAHGFNSVHGRMPSVTTGAALANRDLVYIGVSGDGDTASIGLGQFCHAVRRRLNMTYIVMNNGCYGLTKGQFSATNDKASPSKKGEANPFEAIDLAQMAIQLGAGFVARSFSGDKAQLIPLIKAAIGYNGFALLDVISPCVTFNNHATSTKSYEYVRAHNMASENQLDYVEPRDEITVDYAEGATADIELHDGSRLILNKLGTQHDPRDADAALMAIRTNAAKGAVTTGLLYIDAAQQDMHDILATDARPLNAVPMAELCPGSKALEAINARLR
jgi:2-oxoglutarate ferredoxin oxidoreductase subunit beta